MNSEWNRLLPGTLPGILIKRRTKHWALIWRVWILQWRFAHHRSCRPPSCNSLVADVSGPLLGRCSQATLHSIPNSHPSRKRWVFTPLPPPSVLKPNHNSQPSPLARSSSSSSSTLLCRSPFSHFPFLHPPPSPRCWSIHSIPGRCENPLPSSPIHPLPPLTVQLAARRNLSHAFGQPNHSSMDCILDVEAKFMGGGGCTSLLLFHVSFCPTLFTLSLLFLPHQKCLRHH